MEPSGLWKGIGEAAAWVRKVSAGVSFAPYGSLARPPKVCEGSRSSPKVVVGPVPSVAPECGNFSGHGWQAEGASFIEALGRPRSQKEAFLLQTLYPPPPQRTISVPSVWPALDPGFTRSRSEPTFCISHSVEKGNRALTARGCIFVVLGCAQSICGMILARKNVQGF